MDEFLKMDIFFFVTTIAIIVVALFLAYVLWRFHRILKHIEYISEQVAMESDIVRQDIAEMRSGIRSSKGHLKSLLGFLGKFGKKRTTKKS